MSFDLNETPQLAKEAMHRVLTKDEKKAIVDTARKEYEAGNIEFNEYVRYSIKNVPILAAEVLQKTSILGFDIVKASSSEVNLSEVALVHGENWLEEIISFNLSETPQLAKEAMHRVLTAEEKERIQEVAKQAYETGIIEFDEYISYSLKHVPIPATEALYEARIIGFEGLKASGVNLLEAAVVYGKDWHENL